MAKKIFSIFVIVIISINISACFEPEIKEKDDVVANDRITFRYQPYVKLNVKDWVNIDLKYLNSPAEVGSNLGWVKWDYIYEETNWEAINQENSVYHLTETNGGKGGVFYSQNYNDKMLRNYSFQIDMKMPQDNNLSDKAAMGVIFRSSYSLSQHKYKLLMQKNSMYLYFEKSSDLKLLKKANIYRIPDKWYTVKVELNDNNISVYLDGNKKINFKSKYKAIGQFGPYASNAKGVKFKNFKFTTDEQIKIYGSKYKTTVKTNNNRVKLTEKSYKKIMGKDIKGMEVLRDINNLQIIYNSRSEHENVNFDSTKDGNEKIWADIIN